MTTNLNTALRANALRVAHVANPRGVDVRDPSFSWAPVGTHGDRQTAYAISVGTDAKAVAQGNGDRWNSGKVPSEDVAGAVYAGMPLQSRERLWWSVQLWNAAGVSGGWAEPHAFEMGLLSPSDWSARWIRGAANVSSPLLRQTFTLDGESIRQARVYVTGLGNYELHVNGERLGRAVLDPSQTTYTNDPDLKDASGKPTKIRSPRVLYAVYDVKDQLRAGANAIGLMLGHGWYSAESDVLPTPLGRSPYGERPCGLLQLEVEYTSGRRIVVASDETWRAKAGPITYNDFCHGETFDARAASLGWANADHDDTQWARAELAPAPDGVLRAQIMPPVEVMQTLPALSSTYPSDGVEVVDFGQHMAGWSRLSVSGPAGATIVLRHAGAINDRGELNNENNMPPYSNARQTDTYILRGDSEEVFEPAFTLHGFRYVEITQSNGPVRVNKIEARVAHSAVPQSGVFECDNALLNQIHRNVHWTLRASLQGGPQDAAERFERLFWLGDPGWMMDEYLYNFDAAAFWLKWLDDIQDCELPDGNLPFVAPLHWRGPCPGIYKFMEDLPYATWPDFSTTTFPVIVMKLFEFYGDKSIIERHYQTMANAHRFVEGVTVDDRLECGFGEHMEPQPDGTCVTQTEKTPMPLVSTSWYFHITQLLERAANVIGRDADAHRYKELASRIQAAFAKAFIDERTGEIPAETQSTLVIPLWHGVIPERYRAQIAQKLVADVERKGALDTGTMGTAALKHVLRDCGRSDLMFRLATSTSYPSWGNQVVRGATTIWESWGGDGERSLNMKLLASIDAFFYRDVAGLSSAAPGWRRLRIRPAVTQLLDRAQAKVATPRGPARVDWKRENGQLKLAVDVPTTSDAEIYLPAESGESIRAGDVVIWDGHRPTEAGIPAGSMSHENGFVRFVVGGGRHAFTVETSF